MNFNYMKEMLLSDLLCLYHSTNESKYLKEIKNRMLFCGYTNNEIAEFIQFENDILNSKEEKYNKKIIEKHYIIGKNKNKYARPDCRIRSRIIFICRFGVDEKRKNAASGIGHFFFFLSNLNPQLVRMGILQRDTAIHGIKF